MNRIHFAALLSALQFGCASTPKERPAMPATPSVLNVCLLPSINRSRMELFNKPGYFREVRYINGVADTGSCDLIVDLTKQGRSWVPLSLFWPIRYQHFDVSSGARKHLWKFKTYAIADNQIDAFSLAGLYEHFQPGSAAEKNALEFRGNSKG